MLPYVVVDASVAGAWTFAEVFSTNAQPVLAALFARRITALAPDRFAEEFLRICQKKTSPPPAGAGVAPSDAFERYLDVMTSPLFLVPSAEYHEEAWDLAHTVGITVHDALYVAVARRWGAELWTLDVELAARAAAAYPAVHDLRLSPFPY